MFDEDDEEVLGEPSFELRLRNGAPQVTGCYFMHPPLHATSVTWDDQQPGRILVTADDGSLWFADGVPRSGTTNVVLQRVAT